MLFTLIIIEERKEGLFIAKLFVSINFDNIGSFSQY